MLGSNKRISTREFARKRRTDAFDADLDIQRAWITATQDVRSAVTGNKNARSAEYAFVGSKRQEDSDRLTSPILKVFSRNFQKLLPVCVVFFEIIGSSSQMVDEICQKALNESKGRRGPEKYDRRKESQSVDPNATDYSVGT